ncbi:MAG TPA: 3-methyl-2-oxobutanoate hydroxymethyltransferase [Longimicrobiales bacterium]|nr:3-methyl-2-oxobutanoate hydroxymethyltransferase [Longimicrobiales bacterium]
MSTEARRRNPRASILRLLELKEQARPIVAMTAYDVLFARLLASAEVDLILVGDSLGQVVLGYDSTIPVTLDEMIHHARAVKRGAPGTLVVLDMPFMSYQTSVEDALRNAGRALKEAGVEAVKLEGGHERTCEAIRALVAAGIPVMGHIGLTPQSVHALGGYRVQGRGEAEAERIRREARALEEAGVFSMVLELVPAPLAREISRALTVPTVGIGAGAGCDGQVLVLYDALGMNPGFGPKFLKRFANLHDVALEGVQAYAREVREGTYPGPEHSFDGD